MAKMARMATRVTIIIQWGPQYMAVKVWAIPRMKLAKITPTELPSPPTMQTARA